MTYQLEGLRLITAQVASKNVKTQTRVITESEWVQSDASCFQGTVKEVGNVSFRIRVASENLEEHILVTT